MATRRPSLHFFTREPDGGVRVRLRFTGELASLIEEAAGQKPLMPWIYEALEKQAKADVRTARRNRITTPPDST